MERSDLNDKIQELFRTDKYSDDQKRRAVQRFSKTSEKTNAEIGRFIGEADDISSGLAQSVLATRNETITTFDKSYGGAWATLSEEFFEDTDEKIRFEGTMAGYKSQTPESKFDQIELWQSGLLKASNRDSEEKTVTGLLVEDFLEHKESYTEDSLDAHQINASPSQRQEYKRRMRKFGDHFSI